MKNWPRVALAKGPWPYRGHMQDLKVFGDRQAAVVHTAQMSKLHHLFFSAPHVFITRLPQASEEVYLLENG